MQPLTKTQQLVGFMRDGRWDRALSLANTFRMLGNHRAAIRLAHECRIHPRFYRGLGRDTEAAVAAGIAALLQLYPPREVALDISSYQYRGYTLVRMPSGAVLVHDGLDQNNVGPLKHQADSVSDATSWIDQMVGGNHV